ncbi:hypothetical protein DL98DRAFT_188740 [Cadophora sp. DSE1049]|nr:hypothetical protein DL98DRAFT_188740 [Cadophora sp. DSE1049]
MEIIMSLMTEEIDDVQTDEELDGDNDFNSGDVTSDGGGSDQGSDGGFDDSDWIDSEEEAEAARETLINELTPLLEALLQPPVPRAEATGEERYLQARALLVAPPAEGEDDDD